MNARKFKLRSLFLALTGASTSAAQHIIDFPNSLSLGEIPTVPRSISCSPSLKTGQVPVYNLIWLEMSFLKALIQSLFN